ncbi:MAG: thioesterase [Ruminiclostridium sp.]|nr:thioesterase [Ruminiclostridium sp.]
MGRPKLFCFTYAGGNAAFFDLIEKDLPDIELVKFEYAGHGTRHKEAFYNDFDELADDIYGVFRARYSGGDYALFGYSMGAVALAEVLKRILGDKELDAPSHVFLAAHEPHSKAELVGYADESSDEWVRERTIRFGAVPEKLINNKSFWRIYLPLYKADYSIIGKYRFEELGLRTTVPAAVFYSETDTPTAEMELWKNYFVGRCELYRYEGNHFFIREHHKEIAAVINGKMKS